VAAFSEEIVAGFRYVYEGDLVVSERSAFQQIDIYEHPSFGKTLVLDGLVQTTERDEFIYHEMLAHVPLLALDQPRSVLIIGGGDGGTLRHVLMHPSVERAVMVEIDERVTELCRKHIASIAGDAFDDPRADVRFDDGVAFVEHTTEKFDAILIDSSDPVGPGEGLFTAQFYANAAKILSPGGLLAAQSGSPLVQQGELHRTYQHVKTVFADARPYLLSVPTYPGTMWSFMLCGERIDIDPGTARARAEERGISAMWWTPAVQRGAFDLPQVVVDVLEATDAPHTFGLSPEERNRRALP
jgi:spermidine synthase